MTPRHMISLRRIQPNTHSMKRYNQLLSIGLKDINAEPVTNCKMLVRGGLMVRVRSSTWGSTFFSLFFSIPASLLMGSLPLQTIVNTWQHFHLFKACTKHYVVNSCLANTDNEAVSH